MGRWDSFEVSRSTCPSPSVCDVTSELVTREQQILERSSFVMEMFLVSWMTGDVSWMTGDVSWMIDW